MTIATRICRGLQLPITGDPVQQISSVAPVSQVALLADDYLGMKPTMLVQTGERVLLGQPLFEDKTTPGVLFTSPATGTVATIHRGEKRKFESLVIDIDVGNTEQKIFTSHQNLSPRTLDPGQVR